jgi:acetyl-CoA synthetase
MPDAGDRPPEATSPPGATIEDYFSEHRVFAPSDAFRRDAVANDPAVYERAEADWQKFWAEQAGALD